MINDANEARAYAAAGSKYIHLLDGGITDNIGVRSIVDMARRQNRRENLTLLGRSEKIEKLGSVGVPVAKIPSQIVPMLQELYKP